MTVLLVAAGGAAGAVLRYLTDRRIQGRHDSVFPWGTFAANALGSLVLAFLAGLALFGSGNRIPALQALVGTGFCGALTTYSTFGYETVRLFSGGARLFAVVNVVATVLAGLGAGALGFALAAAVRL